MKLKVQLALLFFVLAIGQSSAQITREKIVAHAEEYVGVQWYCSPANINHPEYLQYGNQPCDFSVGWYTGEAYSYGGNDDVPTFLARIARGDGAGSHLSHYNAAGGTPWWATGIDCSAFVSRCWEIARQSTRTLPNYSTEIARSELLAGDILNIPANHVRLFDRRASDGRPIVYEASGSATRCVHRVVDWGSYTPLRFNELMIAAPHLRVENLGNRSIRVSWEPVDRASRYQLYFSTDAIAFTNMGETRDCSRTFDNLAEGQVFYFRVVGVNDSSELGIMSEVLGARATSQRAAILIVNGFDRMSSDLNLKNYIVYHARPLVGLNQYFDSCCNEAVVQNRVDLKNYAAVIWILGEESTADRTFDSQEQAAVRSYLENGGKLFVTGAEIGWDLDYYNHGRSFYQNYLKARYVADDANVYQVRGVAGSIFEGISALKFDDGTHGTYNVDYPDCIEPVAGSLACLTYEGTSFVAGVQYEGTFGASTKIGKLVYFGFPFETIYPETDRNQVMERIIHYFGLGTTVATDESDWQPTTTNNYPLFQNYPNPFNSITMIKFSLPRRSQTRIEIYNILGKKIAVLLDANLDAGIHQLSWDGTDDHGDMVAAGTYLLVMTSEGYHQTRKILLLN